MKSGVSAHKSIKRLRRRGKISKIMRTACTLINSSIKKSNRSFTNILISSWKKFQWPAGQSISGTRNSLLKGKLPRRPE
jgi:hypothetical protein